MSSPTWPREQQVDDKQHRWRENFRSRPIGAGRACRRCSAAGPDAFAQDGIEFARAPRAASCRDEDLQLDGAALPALNLLVAGAGSGQGQYRRAPASRATQACVGGIHALLAAGLDGRAMRVDRKGERRALAPGDIAVLVASATTMPTACSRRLADARHSLRRGRAQQPVPDRRSAAPVLAVEALLAPADDQRLRAALAAPLLGTDAADAGRASTRTSTLTGIGRIACNAGSNARSVSARWRCSASCAPRTRRDCLPGATANGA